MKKLLAVIGLMLAITSHASPLSCAQHYFEVQAGVKAPFNNRPQIIHLGDVKLHLAAGYTDPGLYGYGVAEWHIHIFSPVLVAVRLNMWGCGCTANSGCTGPHKEYGKSIPESCGVAGLCSSIDRR